MNSATDQTEVYPDNLEDDQDIYTDGQKPEVLERRRPSDMPSKTRHSEYANEEDVDVESIDESVKEYMQKLEDTFPGISERFRMLNRIGEGETPCCCHGAPANDCS
jgi:cell division control protein 7